MQRRARLVRTRGLRPSSKKLCGASSPTRFCIIGRICRNSRFVSEFAAFPWRSDDAQLKSWQRGQTGYPIVDAGMRELWHTGYMHNRVRMIVASFLIKHLLLPWQAGEAWFWDTLVDADLASNAASWQWVAGSGADAAPYFRIFNPVTQGEKFDTRGVYVRTLGAGVERSPRRCFARALDRVCVYAFSRRRDAWQNLSASDG